MNNIEYVGKELAIFNGIIDLIKNGANVYSITVSEIAMASYVGKGTIYDYFNTKEEAISKAIVYNINNEIEYAIDKIASKSGFKNKYYGMLNIIAENLENRLFITNILLSVGGFQEFYKYLIDEKHVILSYISRVEKVIDELLELGFKEKMISIDENQYYKRMVIKGSISSFAEYINMREYYPEVSVGKAMDLSYKMVTKSLN